MVVWSASRPRSLSSSSTSRNESEYRRYQRTAHRISAGSVCRHLKIVGRIACFTISSGYQPPPAKVIDMSETVKREYQEKLGQDFGTVFYGVWNDWLNGLVRLKEYRALFTDPARPSLPWRARNRRPHEDSPTRLTGRSISEGPMSDR